VAYIVRVMSTSTCIQVVIYCAVATRGRTKLQTIRLDESTRRDLATRGNDLIVPKKYSIVPSALQTNKQNENITINIEGKASPYLPPIFRDFMQMWNDFCVNQRTTNNYRFHDGKQY
jgi:hypothetical protein